MNGIGFKGISNSTLKLIAIITMLIDHIGAVFLSSYILSTGNYIQWIYLYDILRDIGRIAFPIFCFLLIQGVEYTHNKLKYGIRLLAFAIISEPFFDYALAGKWIDIGYQNVIFTLFFGYASIALGIEFSKKLQNKYVSFIIRIGLVALAAIICYILKTDYSYSGIICIALMYFLRENRLSSTITAIAILSILLGSNEIFSLLAVIPIYFYNNKRGLKLKYVFYIFYPLHLFILGFLTNYLIRGFK